MRKSKFTDSQIMDAVKRVEAGFAMFVAGNTASGCRWS
jgi:hypothetical protein